MQIAILDIQFSNADLANLDILLVDSCTERGALLADTLQNEGFRLVAVLSLEDDLLNAVEQHSPDAVIIDLESPGRDTLDTVRSLQSTLPRPLVMFSQNGEPDLIRKAVTAGVTAYVVDGIQTKHINPLLDEAIVRFEQHQALEAELAATKAQLRQRKLIEKAKGIVMKQRGCDEGAAYQLLRTQAMRQNKKLIDVADSVITAAELLDP